MGVAALVLGILALIVSFIPGCGAVIGFIPALIGLILGIVDTVRKSKQGEKKGISIAGLVLSAIAIVIMIAWFFIAQSIATDANVVKSLDELQRTLETSGYDYNY